MPPFLYKCFNFYHVSSFFLVSLTFTIPDSFIYFYLIFLSQTLPRTSCTVVPHSGISFLKNKQIARAKTSLTFLQDSLSDITDIKMQNVHAMPCAQSYQGMHILYIPSNKLSHDPKQFPLPTLIFLRAYLIEKLPAEPSINDNNQNRTYLPSMSELLTNSLVRTWFCH